MITRIFSLGFYFAVTHIDMSKKEISNCIQVWVYSKKQRLIDLYWNTLSIMFIALSRGILHCDLRENHQNCPYRTIEKIC